MHVENLLNINFKSSGVKVKKFCCSPSGIIITITITITINSTRELSLICSILKCLK